MIALIRMNEQFAEEVDQTSEKPKKNQQGLKPAFMVRPLWPG